MIKVDDGFYYGLGAFETIALENGVPVFLERHFARLQRAMEFLKIHHSIEEIQMEVENVLEKSEIKSGRQVLKITVTPDNIIVTHRKNSYTEKNYQEGFTTSVSKIRRNETSPFTYHKTLNYGECIYEKRLAHKNGIDEPVFLNMKGEITEGACTNVFFVKKDEIYTPPVSCGLLPGILREYICDKYPIKQQVIYPENLDEFDEMFLTNSLLGIMPVTRIDDFHFSSTQKSHALLEKYLNEIKMSIKR